MQPPSKAPSTPTHTVRFEADTIDVEHKRVVPVVTSGMNVHEITWNSWRLVGLAEWAQLIAGLDQPANGMWG